MTRVNIRHASSPSYTYFLSRNFIQLAFGIGGTVQWPNAQCSCDSDEASELLYCMKCDDMFCKSCWMTERRHAKPGHEETLPSDAMTIHTTLKVRLEEYSLLQEAVRLYSQKTSPRRLGARSEWFGVTAKNETGNYHLSEGPAYEDMVLEPCGYSSPGTFPALVSFVGETGCGKSTLISLLIKFSKSRVSSMFRTPIVGESGSRNSTSSNVHLYADPATFLKKHPILYADCEGMDGDEVPAELSKNGQHQASSDSAGEKLIQFNPQKIDWQDATKDGETVSRRRITKTLFPRILYIFSDVVVYIVHNRIRLEDTLLHLIAWAHQATEQAYNKPVLPCAIIAFMNKDGQVDPEDYDIDTAKRNVFAKLNNIRRYPDLQQYVEYWEKNNNSIETAQALLSCYYSSVSVVNFPNGQLPSRMRKQAATLYNKISESCRESQKRRERARMMLSASTLPLYIRKAFTHFATHCHTPFDFSDAWIDLHSVSFNLEGSIFNLATKFGRLRRLRGMRVWEEIAPFVASCLLLNWFRKQPPGDFADATKLPKKIWEQCDKAALDYWWHYWPCQHKDDFIGSCVNSPSGHELHQGQNKRQCKVNDREVKDGSLWSHTAEQLQAKFRELVEEALSKLAEEAGSEHRGTESLQRVSALHLRNVNTFCKKLDNVDDFSSHSTCLMCLDGIPEHCLPCGHVICSTCVETAGSPIAGGFVELERCPLLEHRGEDWRVPWVGSVKPDQAGLRILALDGGGIKGIVELDILKRIQEQLGSVPLREFFDLIVGTSAGGIIACGLGPAHLTVQECALKFETLSAKAFSSSSVRKIPLIGKLVDEMFSVFNHGRYKTKSLEDAYKEAFPENLKLFGGAGSAASVKVAVTTSTKQGGVIVLGNYNRKPPAQAFYDFQRPPPEREMRLWEAARATSAAPTYFAPYAHSGTSQVYLDGGLWHNNPIRIADAESRAIWPSSKPRQPDLILSIGGGFHETESTLTEGAQKYHEQIKAEAASQEGRGQTWRDNDDYVRFLVSVVLSQIKSSLSCERIWHEWLEARAPGGEADRRRYRRLTVEFPKVVEMDDASEEAMDVCHDAVKGMEGGQFVEVADRLIASCFFFHFGTEDIVKLSDGRFEVSGTLLCRLQPESIAKLADHLETLSKPTPSFRPYFIVRETHEEKGSRICIEASTLAKMKQKGRFAIPCEIRVSSTLAETEILLVLRGERQRPADVPHISGFPRKLQHDYDVEFIRSVGNINRRMHRVLDWFTGQRPRGKQHILTLRISST
ncbi:hypothetical protein CDD80_7598 [Ophiocordyceps camponoti-rufipedis]|uniref:PNPLA domain-containing protein n=1 Tax=Ophiocordyceps camponoti-rufipedis TaxID=2004952 RepID=A0A2C5ZD22_9HYPO|nr:hypothetical protein CDD80_7598 [Ophiocordyceps camponoti-rufipedis]